VAAGGRQAGCDLRAGRGGGRGSQRVGASAAVVGGRGGGNLRLGQEVAVTGGRSGGNPAGVREREGSWRRRGGERKWIDAMCGRAVDHACERRSERRKNRFLDRHQSPDDKCFPLLIRSEIAIK
jgi:hypothetical protein